MEEKKNKKNRIGYLLIIALLIVIIIILLLKGCTNGKTETIIQEATPSCTCETCKHYDINIICTHCLENNCTPEECTCEECNGVSIRELTWEEYEEVMNQVPVGNVSVYSHEVKKKEEPTPEPVETGTITFTGFGRCTITDTNPMIQLSNHKDNFVDMVFTIIDAKTNKVIVRTNKVKPGEYAYVDMVQYYKTKGSYQVYIDTATYDGDTPCNGTHQQAEIIYK